MGAHERKAGPFAGLVLAAGGSLRYGRESKLLLPFGDLTVVGASVRAAVTAGLEPVVVVVGDDAEEVRAAVSRAVGERAARVVENRRWPEGIGTSLAVGATELAADPVPAAIAILLADEPDVSPSIIRAVTRAWAAARLPVAAAVYRDRPGHPVVADRSLLPLLERAAGDFGLRTVLATEKIAIHAVAIDRPAPTDIDEPDDYERALRRFGE